MTLDDGIGVWRDDASVGRFKDKLPDDMIQFIDDLIADRAILMKQLEIARGALDLIRSEGPQLDYDDVCYEGTFFAIAENALKRMAAVREGE